MTQDSRPSRSRNPTARSSAPTSPHNARTRASFSAPELMVATRNNGGTREGGDYRLWGDVWHA